jgi:hypothetical protein
MFSINVKDERELYFYVEGACVERLISRSTFLNESCLENFYKNLTTLFLWKALYYIDWWAFGRETAM